MAVHILTFSMVRYLGMWIHKRVRNSMLYYVLGITLHEKQEKHQESIGMDSFLQGEHGELLLRWNLLGKTAKMSVNVPLQSQWSEVLFRKQF